MRYEVIYLKDDKVLTIGIPTSGVDDPLCFYEEVILELNNELKILKESVKDNT